jgi:hypothetical protein
MTIMEAIETIYRITGMKPDDEPLPPAPLNDREVKATIDLLQTVRDRLCESAQYRAAAAIRELEEVIQQEIGERLLMEAQDKP